MKVNFIVALLTIASLAACTSTTETSQVSGTPAGITNKIDSGEKLTDKDLNELAGKANFSAAQLKAAAKNLGYKCSFFAVTGSHIKKKVCTTQQQRDVRAEAAKAYVRNITSANTAPASL
jgi:hypothetical protein